MKNLSNEALSILNSNGFKASNEEMEKNIGRIIRMKPEKWTESYGLMVKESTYTVIGIQKDYKGDLCYRAICNAFNDTFGRPFNPEDIEFLTPIIE